MLVLSRKVGETIVIGDSIEVTVERIAGKRIRIKIDAPPAVKVLRKEIADRLPRSN